MKKLSILPAETATMESEFGRDVTNVGMVVFNKTLDF